MVRVSGSRDVLQREGIDQVLSEAESLLQAYQVGSEAGQSRLRMSFGAVGVNRALASIGAPVWGANRPLTLAWVAVEDRGSRSLLTRSGAGAEWRDAFRQAAGVRGLPMEFPSENQGRDRALLSDLWGQFIGRIKKASDDVSSDVLALVQVSRSADGQLAGYVGRWLEHGGVSIGAGQGPGHVGGL